MIRCPSILNDTVQKSNQKSINRKKNKIIIKIQVFNLKQRKKFRVKPIKNHKYIKTLFSKFLS